MTRKKSPHVCPHCGGELNLGSLVAKARWDNATSKDRKDQHAMLTRAKNNKK